MRKHVSPAGLSLAVAVAVLLLALPAGSLASPGEAQQPSSLFVPAAGAGSLERGARPAVVRSRAVEVNVAALQGSGPRRLALNLFEDLVLDALLEGVDELPGGGRAWRGRRARGNG